MWVWVNSRSWWRTGKPGVLQSLGLQRIRPDWATELNWTELNPFKVNRISVLIRRDTRLLGNLLSTVHRLNKCQVMTCTKELSTNQEESSHQHPNWLELWSWTFSLQNYETINACCSSHLIYNILLWQPEQNKIRIFSPLSPLNSHSFTRGVGPGQDPSLHYCGILLFPPLDCKHLKAKLELQLFPYLLFLFSL